MVAKKPERQKLDAQCLELWSKCIRTKQRVCRNCGSDYRLQAHHIVQRTYKLSRYNTQNGLCLCAGCHFTEKIDPERFRSMIIGIIGEETYIAMQNKYRVQWKWTVPELREIRDGLKAELKALESDWGGEPEAIRDAARLAGETF